MPDLLFIEADDWVGVYIDGKLDWEGHSLPPRDLLARFAKDVRYRGFDAPLEDYLEEYGGFPNDLADLPPDV